MGELEVQNFCLQSTVEAGHFFRYQKKGNKYVLFSGKKKVTVTQKNNTLLFSGCTQEFLQDFLGTEQDVSVLQQDERIAPIVTQYKHVHIMHPDLHDTILAFICSSMSNVAKIRLNMEALTSLGVQPGMQLSLQEVLATKTGYRAKYIVAANKMLTKEFLTTLQTSSYEEAHTLLQTLPGVGSKVADCICLYGLQQGAAFPVDVHIQRAMQKLFPRSRLTTPARARIFAQKRWKDQAGLANTLLFAWARENL